MPRQFRRALWGYRVHDADHHMAELELQRQERQRLREHELLQRHSELMALEEETMTAEQELQSLQAEYFRLSGEVGHLASRAQELLLNAEAELAVQEEAINQALANREHYSNTLRETIQSVPEQIRAVVEQITDTILHSRSSTLSHPADRLPGVTDVEESSHG